VYEEWGNVMDLHYVSILGGEPLLNPSINEWIKGIRNIWKDTEIEITTNGTRLNHVKNLYKTVNDTNSFLHISVHNQNKFEVIEKDIFKFLEHPVEKKVIVPDDIDDRWKQQYNRVRQSSWEECSTHLDFKELPQEQKQICIDNGLNDKDFLNFNTYYEYVDANSMTILVYIEDVFYHSAVQLNNGLFKLHDSNPSDAHDRCFGKNNHHFIKGKLYKCAISGILPEFIKQFPVEVSSDDLDLINSYIPLSMDNIEDISTFVGELPNEISLCKFCPDGLGASFKLNAVSGDKIKVKKL
jgi:organic radical activating enzyme